MNPAECRDENHSVIFPKAIGQMKEMNLIINRHLNGDAAVVRKKVTIRAAGHNPANIRMIGRLTINPTTRRAICLAKTIRKMKAANAMNKVIKDPKVVVKPVEKTEVKANRINRGQNHHLLRRTVRDSD